MKEKFYTEKYTSFKPRQNLKQATNEAMSYYSYSNFSSNTPVNNFIDVCNMPFQNFGFQQNSHNSIFVQQEQTDVLIWEDRTISNVDITKITNKVDKTEIICSKNLNPGSYCNSVDLITLDSYKESTSKDMHNFENELYNQNNCNQKKSAYASCAQEKFAKCYNIQRNHGIDYMTRNCNYSDMYHENFNAHCRIHNKNVPNEIPDYIYNYDIENQLFTQNSHCFSENAGTTCLINPVDQQTECSNEESDIVVEESDEEISEHSENLEKQLSYPTNKCLICDITYKPLGTQFYFITEKNPLTMSTQTPVFQKLINIIGDVSTTKSYLCSECLGHINSIDHLQLKLEKLKSDLITKFKGTCLENKTKYEKRSCPQKMPHSKWSRYKCKFCNKILCLKKYCLYHIKRHKNGYLCDFCGKIYLNKIKFSLHYKQHKKKLRETTNSFSLKCSNCSKTFRTRFNQREHENFCLNLLPYKCKQHDCDKKFPSATKLKNHVRLKHDKKFIVICSICNIGFIKMSDYKSHIISHSADKKYSCLKCHKNYKTLSNLNFHMKIHSGNIPFNCHICKKGFMRKEYLEAHINNHNGIKHFSCTTCEKKFVSQKNLDAHLKYHQGTVKKNTCNVCGKTMTSGFEEHLRIHNNLKEFECQHCDMKFNAKGTLSKHIKKKHSFIK